MFPVLAGSNPSGYNLTRSLRFRRSATAYLNRTPSVAGNRRIFTWSAWVKTTNFKGQMFTAGPFNLDNYGLIMLNNSTGQLQLNIVVGGGGAIIAQTPAVFRDPSAWYHFVVAVDTTQATNSNGVKMYVNGVQQTLTFPAYTQNQFTEFNNTTTHNLGQLATLGAEYFDGYLAEVNFIDGQQLAASSFGSTNTLTGVWQPARYTGTYGTNGFYLPFTDNSALTTSSNVGLGRDYSGNGNYFATNNISITSGVTYDSMTDVPTLTSATAANFAVLNPLFNSTPTLSAGNLNHSVSSTSNPVAAATIGVSSGKWYWEVDITSSLNIIGIIGSSDTRSLLFVGGSATSYSYYSNTGVKYNNSSATSYGASFTTNDVMGVALDLTAGTLTFYKNGVSQGTAFSGLSGTFFPACGNDGVSSSLSFNFGQRPFSYTPPTGFVALNTFNLPTSTIVKGNTVMDATLWTGNGTSQTITNAAGFKPDFVWIKNRNNVRWHILTDSVRGTNSQLFSNDTAAQEARTDRLTAFNSTGFNVGSYIDVNGNADTFVGWQWQAGQGSSSSNTNGTITSTVSVNASAGFSVVTYTGTGANATVGHGLGVAPRMYIVKRRNGVVDWGVYHSNLTSPAYGLYLNTNNAQFSAPTYWNSTAPTSSVFSIGTDSLVNASGATMVAYCWTPIAGYSAFGSYTGNGSTDGPFVYTGFRPKFILIKRTESTANWGIKDTSRNPSNTATQTLFPSLALEEYSVYYDIDILSNGFKCRASDALINASGGTYIYAAFAENPFKNALAR